MAILWCGGEDIDFPTMGGFQANSNAGGFRSGWARCFLNPSASNVATAKSAAFPGGAVTSAWLSCQWAYGNAATALREVAFGLSGTEKGLGFGSASASSTRFCIFKYDGTTRTELVAETGNSMTISDVLKMRMDMQVINYGASATVNLYLNSLLLCTYTGDVTVTGMTNFDSFFIYAPTGTGFSTRFSEFMVSDTDSRALIGLQTLALTGAGTTTNWTNGTFSNINAIPFTDATPASVNTTGTDHQYNVTDPTSTSYTVAAVKITARMAKSAVPTPTQVKLGYNSGGSVAFGTGATKAVTTGYLNYEQFDALNPITGNAFLQSEMSALQLDIQSA